MHDQQPSVAGTCYVPQQALAVQGVQHSNHLWRAPMSESLALPYRRTAPQVVSSSYAAAAYLASIGFAKKVFLVGQTGVEEELTAHVRHCCLAV